MDAMKKTTLIYLLLAIFTLVSCQSSPVSSPDSTPLAESEQSTPDSSVERNPAATNKAVHDALFETFFPLEKFTNGADREILLEARKVREQMWEKISERSDALWGMRILDLLSVVSWGFPNLSIEKREALLHSLETSMISKIRMGARFLRLYYLYSIYSSKLGEKISGVAPRAPISHPDVKNFVDQHSLKLEGSVLSYDPTSKMVKHKNGVFDVVIVGSGPAGSVIAHEFIQKGLRVLVLEQGPFAIPGAVDTRRVLAMHESGGMRTSKDGSVIFRNGNAVGGGSAINVDLAFAPTRTSTLSRFQEWRKNGIIKSNQWTDSEIQTAYAWVSKKVGTRAVSEKEINANNKILWEGAKRAGRTPSLYELNTFEEGQSPSPVINKKSSVSAFLIPALENKKNPLGLISGAKVTRILWQENLENRQAAGVEFEKISTWSAEGSVDDLHQLKIPVGTKVRIEAKHVIVAAGTMGSPALLLRSGLENPQIGAGPVAHPSIPLIGIFKNPIKVWEGTPASVFVDDHALTDGTILESMSADVGYAAMMLPGDRNSVFETIKRATHIGGFGVLLIDKPLSENKIAINSEGQPEIRFGLGSDDTKRFSRAVAEAVRIMLLAGAEKVILPTNELVQKEFTSVEQTQEIEKNLKFTANRTAITSAHLQSSCKMGNSSTNSAVDYSHRVWGTKNVFVVDSSVFPTSVGANPMQTIYTIAKIFSDHWQ